MKECKYCREVDTKALLELDYIDQEAYHEEYELYVVIGIEGGSLSAWHKDEHSIKINYCPMCGRKLEESVE
jgi:hypothetical protein